MLSKEFIKTVKSNDLSRNGFTTTKRVIRTCDHCSKEEETSWYSASKSHEKYKIDLCANCARKNRNLPTGEDNGHWKHGLTNNGYKRITINGKRALEHQFIMEKILGRSLQDDEEIHHIDNNKLNNSPENLFLCSGSEHQKIHQSMEKCGFLLLGKKIWFDWNDKKYVLNKSDQPELIANEDNVKTYFKVDSRSKTTYEFVNQKIDKQWSWRRYHVVLIEKLIGRPIFKNEIVHHVDGNSVNNNLNNLCLMTSREHGICHNSMQMCISQLYVQNVIVFSNGYHVGSQYESADSQ